MKWPSKKEWIIIGAFVLFGVLIGIGFSGLFRHNDTQPITPNTQSLQYQIDTLLSARKTSDIKIAQLRDSVEQKQAEEKTIYRHFINQYAKVKNFSDSGIVRFRDSILTKYQIK